MKFKKAIPYDILIKATPNQGFVVEVGCVKMVYVGWTNLLRDLTEYFENPEMIEKQYNKDIQSLSRVRVGYPPDLRVGTYEKMQEVHPGPMVEVKL